MIAFGVLIVLAVLAAAADILAQNVFAYTFEKQDLLHTYEKPTFETPAYLLGTDEIGRSQVVRLLYGGRVSLWPFSPQRQSLFDGGDTAVLAQRPACAPQQDEQPP